MRNKDKEEKDEGRSRRLRPEAEAKFTRDPKLPAGLEKMNQEELVYELRVHQIELEMQNDELKSDQAIIEESRDKYVQLYDFAPTGYLTLSRDVVVLEANFATATLLGVDLQKLVDQRFRKFVDPADVERWDRYIVDIFQHDGKGRCELALKRPDGSALYVQIDSVRIDLPAAAGQAPEAVVRASMSDITERKKAEEALRASEAKYRLLAENLPQKIFIKDRNSVYIFCNKNYGRDLKIEAEEIKGKTDYDFYPKELAEKYRADDKRIMESQEAEEIEEKYIQEGVEKIVQTVKAPIADEKGNVTDILGIFWDITERKKMEDQLLFAAKEWRTTFDSITDLISIVNEDFRLIRVNKAFAHTFKLEPKETIGKFCYELVHGAKGPHPECPYKEAQLTRKATKAEFFDTFLNRYLEVSISPIFNNNGDMTNAVHLVRDITERKQAEENLSQALKEEVKSRKIVTSMLEDNNRIREELEAKLQELKQAQSMVVQSEKLASLGTLVADMAHEVNNPLMIISGNAQLSLLDESLKDELKNNLKIIHEECNRAKNIIQRLLMFSRPSKGECKPLDINQSIGSVVKLLEHQFSLSNVKINMQFATGLPLIAADEKQFQEVIMNLLNNARDAMSEGGEITIKTSLGGEYFKIEIKDSGVGMDDKTLARAFEPFFTTKEKGTGLGLSVCYGIIKAHKGKIEFKSQPQKGTTAHIWLPIKAEGA